MRVLPIQPISSLKNNQKHRQENKRKNNLTKKDISVILDIELNKGVNDYDNGTKYYKGNFR